MDIPFRNVKVFTSPAMERTEMTPFRKEYEYFLSLASELNISKAAEKIGVQQAGLSKSLRNLELDLGRELFYRTNRGLLLTPFGKILQKNLIATIDSWQHSFAREEKRFQRIWGKFKFGMHPTLAQNFSPEFFPRICETYPELDLEMVLKSSSQVTKDVIEHNIQFGIVANPEKHSDLIIHKLNEEFVACWSSTPKNYKKILYYNPDMVEVARKLRNFKEYKKVPINDYEVIAANMSTATGLALLPSSVATKYPCLKQVGAMLFKVRICLIYRYDIQKSMAFDAILEEIKKGLKTKAEK